MTSAAKRVVVWSTGGVGANAIRAIAHRPDLDLVGVWVHSPDKVGRDAGDLAGIDPLGLLATDDVDALIALQPDCVVYAASGPERGAGAVPHYERLLTAGINVVTTTSTELVFPPAADAALRQRLDRRRSRRRVRSTRRASSPDSLRTSSPCCSRPCRGTSAACA